MNVASTNPYSQTAYETKASAANASAAAKSDEAEKTDKADKAEADKADEKAAVYVASTSKKTGTTGKTDYDTINRLKKDLESRQAQLKSLVVDMLKKQGKTANDALSGMPYTVDAATQEEAKKLIGEDGYWGVEQTSDRLVEFAKGLTGDDPALVEKMRDAIKKGFGMAGEAWGGKLPDICQQTYDATMKKLDEWAKGASSESSEG